MKTLRSCSFLGMVVFSVLCTGLAFGQVVPSVCQLTLQVVVFQATVSLENKHMLRDEIVNATHIPVIDAGVCSEVVPIAEGISSGDISDAQLASYRSTIQSILIPGDQIYEFTWERTDGSTFTTLGVTNQVTSNFYFDMKFEPIITWGGSGLLLEFETLSDTPDPSFTLTTTVHQSTALGTTGYWAKKIVTVFTSDKKTIEDESETISFTSGLLWDVAATKVATKITLGGVQCKKVVSTITFVTGFKSLKVSGEAGGYKGSVEVEGRLGSNGQHQETDIMCADGTAFHDGAPVK